MPLRRARFLLSALVFGYAFLYLPIFTVVVFAFNESSIVMTWSGFSLKWFEALFHNERILTAAWLSLQIALTTAGLSVVIGTTAAIVMVRFKKFKGRPFFNSLVSM